MGFQSNLDISCLSSQHSRILVTQAFEMNQPAEPRWPALLQTLNIIAQPTQFLERCARQYGDTFTLRVLGPNSPPVVFLSHPDAIQAVFTSLSDRLELGKVTHVFEPLTGTQSLIMQDGERHQRLRQLLMPPLHGKQLQNYGHLIQSITDHAIADWSLWQPIAIREWMSELSLQVILQVVFGLTVGPRYLTLKRLLHRLLESVTSTLNSVQFFLPPLQQNLGSWSPWGRFLRLRQQIDQLIYAEIRDRRSALDEHRPDILTLLMVAQDEQGQGLTDVELRDQLMTLLLLGHETTASALTWAFYWLYREPRTLDTLLQELSTVDDQTDPTAIAQLPYLSAVCQEALRVHPIALISQPRWVQQPVQLMDFQFNPGTVLVPCIYLAHRRSATYPNPDQFQPERFIDRKFSPYEYFPFGGGSRSCIGMALSLYEMKLILAQVLRRYQLQPATPNFAPSKLRAIRRGITFVPPSFQLLATASTTSSHSMLSSNPIGRPT